MAWDWTELLTLSSCFADVCHWSQEDSRGRTVGSVYNKQSYWQSWERSRNSWPGFELIPHLEEKQLEVYALWKTCQEHGVCTQRTARIKVEEGDEQFRFGRGVPSWDNLQANERDTWDKRDPRCEWYCSIQRSLLTSQVPVSYEIIQLQVFHLKVWLTLKVSSIKWFLTTHSTKLHRGTSIRYRESW